MEKLKLAYKGTWKIYQNDRGQYITGINFGVPFVIPISYVKHKGNMLYYVRDNERAKTSFLIICDGSYVGASIIDIDSRYIIFPSSHNNTTIKTASELEEQIEMNQEFTLLHSTLMKEIAKCHGIIRIFRIGRLRNKNVYINEFSPNKEYYPAIPKFDFWSKNVFLEFVEKEKCFIARRWWNIEYI